MKNSEILEKLKTYRNKLNMTQEEVAQLIGVKRAVYQKIESGETALRVELLQKLADIYETTADDILCRPPQVSVSLGPKKPKKIDPKAPTERISVPSEQVEKFKEVVLYILEKCGHKPNVGETVLYKLLYFADFNFYEKYEQFLTGSTYRKLQHGPVPLQAQAILTRMIEENDLTKENTTRLGFPQKRYLPRRKSNLNLLLASEKEVLDEVIDRLSDKSATWLSDYSHGDIPWEATALKEEIDYELVFYRAPAYSVRDYEEGFE